MYLCVSAYVLSMFLHPDALVLPMPFSRYSISQNNSCLRNFPGNEGFNILRTNDGLNFLFQRPDNSFYGPVLDPI